MNIAGVIAKPSVDYVRTVFSLYESQRPFISIASAKAAEALPGLTITEIIEPHDGGGWFTEHHQPRSDDTIAQVNFTSGTTGTPKGIQLTGRALSDTVFRLIDVMGMTSDIREYVGVPPSYSFGLGRIRACSAVGGRTFLPSRGFDPAEIAAMLEAGEINALSAVPTLLRLLLAQPDIIGSAGAAMKWIEIGSQHMTAAEKKALRELFPAARIVQHYGLTEASRSTFLVISDVEERYLDSVGKPTGDVEVAISDEGRIRIRGPHVARQCIGKDGTVDLVDSSGWLTTNDLGTIEDGYLFYRGRCDDLINMGGVKLVPDRIEQDILAKLGLAGGLAVARVPDALRGDGVLVAIEGDSGIDPDHARTASNQVLSALGVSAGNSLHVITIDRLPATATGKVQRQALAASFAATMPQAQDSPSSQGDRASGASATAIFARAFPTRDLRGTDSFISLGGDSLAYIGILSHLEQRLGELPDGWEELPLAELDMMVEEAQPRSGGVLSIQPVGSDQVVRSVGATMVVVHHVLQLEVPAGVDLLLILAGLSLGRFQRARLLSTERWRVLQDSFRRIGIPYLVILLAFGAIQWRTLHVSDFLFVSNFFGIRGTLVVAYWFVGAYFQSIILMTLAVWAFADSVSKQPFRFGLALLATSLIAKLSLMALFQHDYLLNRTPDQFFYLIALGWCIHFAATFRQKAVIALIALGAAFLESTGNLYWVGFGGSTRGWVTAAAVWVLLFVPHIPLPSILRRAVVTISAASFGIYLSHPFFMIPFLVANRHVPFVRTGLGQGLSIVTLLALGVAASAVFDWVPQVLQRWRKPRAGHGSKLASSHLAA